MTGSEPGQEPHSPQDSRLTSLEQRLDRVERAEGERKPAIDRLAGRSAGMRMAQSLVGMPLGGAIIGWLLDHWLGTAPWIMLALMFIGFAGAVIDGMKASKQGVDKDMGK